MKSTKSGRDLGVNTLAFKEVNISDERLKEGLNKITKIFKKETMETGKIYNEKKFRQQLLFDGISNDKRTGTDGDWIYESKKDGLFIMAEVKEYGKELSIKSGQGILMENLVMNMGGCYKTYGFVLWHNVASSEDILLKDTIVREVYYKDTEGKFKVKTYKGKTIKFKDAFDMLKKC